MSELTTRLVNDTYFEYYITGKHELAQIYLKSEADKVIAHHKYKRCLAMAMWCERKRIDAANYRIPRQKWDFYDKWHRRWLELAKKFKPNNSTAQ